MTDQYTPPYHITPGILHSIEQIGEALGNLRLHSESIAIPVHRIIEESALMSDQESDYQSDQVMRMLLSLRKSQRSASDLMTELGRSHRPTFRKNYLHPALSEKMSEKILTEIRNNRNITIAELSGLVGVTTRTVERNLKKLQESGLLERIGSAKGGYWTVKEES